MIYVTNGGGYVGGEVVRLLVQAGHLVRALAESREEHETAKRLGAEVVAGDRRQPETFAHTLAGAEIAMLIMRHVPELAELDAHFIDAAKAAGVKRLVKVSAFNAGLDQQGAKLPA